MRVPNPGWNLFFITALLFLQIFHCAHSEATKTITKTSTKTETKTSTHTKTIVSVSTSTLSTTKSITTTTTRTSYRTSMLTSTKTITTTSKSTSTMTISARCPRNVRATAASSLHVETNLSRSTILQQRQIHPDLFLPADTFEARRNAHSFSIIKYLEEVSKENYEAPQDSYYIQAHLEPSIAY